MTYFNALKDQKIDHVSDMLELVESHYLPRIKPHEQDIKLYKNRLQQIRTEIQKQESLSKIRDEKDEVETLKNINS